MSDLSLLLCRLLGSDDPQDQELPLQVLVNLAKGKFNPIYHLLMGTAVEAGWNFAQDPIPWDIVAGDYYSPGYSPSHTFGFAIKWPDGLDWMNAHFDASSVRERGIITNYGKLSESVGSTGAHAYEITEPLVALFFTLCYVADRGIGGNETWLEAVANSQRSRWEALLSSELYCDYLRELGLQLPD
jgi:hypothetical protein